VVQSSLESRPWPLAQFSDATGTIIGAPSSNSTGLTNAVNAAETDLVVSYMTSGGTPSNTGIPASFRANSSATEANCTGGSPAVNCDGLERLDTLADILAARVISANSSSTPCSTLFTDTGVSNSASTLAIAHAIVTNPTNNASGIYAVLSSPATAPFQPTLESAPLWDLALNFAPIDANFSTPYAAAVDVSGDVWVSNLGNTVAELIGLARPVLTPLVACLMQSPPHAVCLP